MQPFLWQDNLSLCNKGLSLTSSFIIINCSYNFTNIRISQNIKIVLFPTNDIGPLIYYISLLDSSNLGVISFEKYFDSLSNLVIRDTVHWVDNIVIHSLERKYWKMVDVKNWYTTLNYLIYKGKKLYNNKQDQFNSWSTETEVGILFYDLSYFLQLFQIIYLRAFSTVTFVLLFFLIFLWVERQLACSKTLSFDCILVNYFHYSPLF